MKRRDFLKGSVGMAAGAATVLAVAQARADTAAQIDASFNPALWIDDVAILNARVITMNPAEPTAQAVLVRRGRIVAVGSNGKIRGLARGAKNIDAGGRTLVPGFVDTHMHLEWSSAATVLMVDLHTPVPKTITEVLARLKTAANATPPGKWIVAEGYLSELAEKRLPTLAELDSVTQQHPLVLFNGVHVNVANTLGAQGMGYLTATDLAQDKYWSSGQPFTGGFAERDAEGHPGAAYDMVMRLPRNVFPVEDMKRAVRTVAKEMFVAGGVTSASPLCLLSSNEYTADQQLQALGELPLRLRAYYMCPFSASVESVLQTGVTRGFGNDMFRTGGFKLIMDSSHPGHPTDHHYTEAAFANLLTTIHAAGLQTMTHCTSADGADMVTNAVEEVRRRLPQNPVIHHRVEHHRARMELARRIRDDQMYFSMIAPQVHTRNGGTGSGLSSAVTAPFRSYIAEGIHPILISDKCGGGPLMPRPMFSIAAACNSLDNGGAAPEGETVEFDDALRMWTVWAAQSSHQDHDRGSIEVGKLGDFALLSGNPHAVAARQLFDIKVDMTILGGKVVYGG